MTHPSVVTWGWPPWPAGLALAGSAGAVAGTILGGAASVQWGVRRGDFRRVGLEKHQSELCLLIWLCSFTMAMFVYQKVNSVMRILVYEYNIWLWVKIKELGYHRYRSRFSIKHPCIGVPNFDPSPYIYTQVVPGLFFL